MKNNRDNQIGYNRQVRLEWLDLTSSMMASGRSTQEIKDALELFLQEQLSVGSNAVRGSRGKTISILLSIWVTVPKHLIELRNEALSLLKRLSTSEHIVLHWGMTMTAYPFFGVVAESAGRMLNLQGSVATVMLKNRMRELYGERQQVARSTRYVMDSFTHWGVLNDMSERGVYRLSASKSLIDQQLQEWLMKALLISEGKNIAPLKTVLRSPRLFPFQFEEPFIPGQHSGLELFRQGLNEEMVMLK
ncbi:MAG: hypothetical protein A2X25_12820 [Chloroflexi bacterium GWB2_49_20]|nr:MAG: hypothetical protein A2X25_12820 [Chloroflexi bacterium GWB2_49_20]OGN78399.1 MAG: hypothetical protein A2X26_01380 [Chloroflexi bacterium GWC2_49_37]OGN84137.1 MAG: hypothetical protein A2X27_14305 [Chloroflexi bacterium GWD2_49_16]HBG75213.1 hypothetical protein [Anaerolineae bacterium]HCC79152.1 hypothetical protein [Anaerolineae bacterium]